MGQLGNVIRGADVEASLSTLWFPNSWRARIVSMFAIGVPVSGVVAAPMSTWIMTRMAGLGGLHGWQWLFLIEGAPAIVLGVIAYFYLRDRPAAARFLTAREKMTIERDLEKEAVGAMCDGSFARALRNPRISILALIYFAFYSSSEHPPVVGRNAAPQRRSARSRRDRRADIAHLCGGRHRDGGHRLEFGSEAGAPLAPDWLWSHRQRGVLPASAFRPEVPTGQP